MKLNTVRGLMPDSRSPRRGRVESTQGTSFAAPVVSGALALMMEHFRGTRGNTQIVRRMLDTADRTGVYAELETYGAGHLDLEAALSPVGALKAGQASRSLQQSTLQTPVAFGTLAARTGDMELATFDDQGFPFWVPLSELLPVQGTGRSPIPELDLETTGVAPATGLEALQMQWFALKPGQDPSQTQTSEWVAGFSPGSVSLARRQDEGGVEYGVAFEQGQYFGARPSGAFGSDLHSGMFWTSHTMKREITTGWTVEATGTVAVSLPRYESKAIFEASPSMLSAVAMRVGTEHTGLTLEQPLRAESGVGTFRTENGRIENGRRLYDVHRVGLRPEAREMRMTLRHERDALGGRIAVELGGAVNAGHTPRERDANIELAFRTTW